MCIIIAGVEILATFRITSFTKSPFHCTKRLVNRSQVPGLAAHMIKRETAGPIPGYS